jgi:hypothetical protein
MGEWAYDSLVGEFLWLGIEPKYALKLAALRYPDEEISFKKDEDLMEYAEIVMDMWFHKYEEFNVNELSDSSEGVIDDIRNKKDYKRVSIYIDGANLLRSYAFVSEKISLNKGVIERKISTKIKNYKKPAFTIDYPLWYISWVLLEVSGIEKALIEKITFVMCADDKETEALLKSIRDKFGFDIIIPSKDGKGLKSSSNEDKVLKDLIISDLQHDVFDIAILGTGDGNKKDGISFPEIATMIKKAEKQVLFTGFDLTTSKKIKQNFEFIDIGLWVLFPGNGGPQILSNEE